MKKGISLVISLTLFLVIGINGVSAQETSDINALRTEIASTVIAEIYGTVNANSGAEAEVIVKVTPTLTPTPRPTSSGIISSGTGIGFWKPTPTYYSYAAKLVSQNRNYFHLAHNLQFTITWVIKNTGPLPWDDEFQIRYVKGVKSLDGDTYWTGPVDQGDSITFSRRFEAPYDPGIYNSYWELLDNEGVPILKNIWVGFQVDDYRDYE